MAPQCLQNKAKFFVLAFDSDHSSSVSSNLHSFPPPLLLSLSDCVFLSSRRSFLSSKAGRGTPPWVPPAPQAAFYPALITPVITIYFWVCLLPRPGASQRQSLAVIPLCGLGGQGARGSLAFHPGRVSLGTGAPWPLSASAELTQQATGQGAEA